MKTLKYGSVFKKVSGGKARVAIETSTGFSLLTTLAGHTLGVRYKGPNNRLFLKDLRKDKNWAVDEIDVVDFDAALSAAFAAPPEGISLQRIDPGVLAEDLAYAGKPVDPKHSNILYSAIWLVKGAVYGTDGHRMHRVKHALPVGEKVYGFNPTMLNAFVALCLTDKKSAWAGAMFMDGKLRLVGGNDAIDVWLDTSWDDNKGYELLVDYFAREEASIDDKHEAGVFLMEKTAGAFLKELETAPRIGDDGEWIGFLITPDEVRFTDKDMLPDRDLPALESMKVLPGKYHLETGLPIKTMVNHKYLTQALALSGRMALLTQGGRDPLWLGAGNCAAIMTPVKFWKEQGDPIADNVKERAEQMANDNEFEATP